MYKYTYDLHWADERVQRMEELLITAGEIIDGFARDHDRKDYKSSIERFQKNVEEVFRISSGARVSTWSAQRVELLEFELKAATEIIDDFAKGSDLWGCMSSMTWFRWDEESLLSEQSEMEKEYASRPRSR